MAKNRTQLRTGPDFLKYAQERGASVRQGKGSHVIVSTKRGSVPIPVHGNEDLGKGLRHAIMKQFMGIGLTVIIIGAVIHYFV